jgi:broad specificity phosphatase PhoE
MISSIIRSFDRFNYTKPLGDIPLSDGVKIILNHALPLTILLPKRVERWAHLSLALVNAKYSKNMFDLAKHGVELGACFSTSKWASVARVGLSLVENLYSVKERERICLIASEAFSLLSLLSTAKKASLQMALVSIGFQAVYRFYRMGQEMVASEPEYKFMKVISNGLMGCIHTLRAYGCYLELQKIQQIVHQIFILMRHADKEKDKGDDPGLTEDGIARSKVAATAIEKLRQELGKDKVQLVVSSLKRSQQTGAVIAQELGISVDSIVKEPDIKERVKGAESKPEIYDRMRKGISRQISPETGTLTVFVSHSLSIRRLFKGLFDLDSTSVPDNFLKNSRYCEISVVEIMGDQWTGKSRQRVELPSAS